jgi:hypothetical protein
MFSTEHGLVVGSRVVYGMGDRDIGVEIFVGAYFSLFPEHSADWAN